MFVSEGLREEGSKRLVEYLGAHHKSFEYRYMKPDETYETVPLRDMFFAFSEFNVAVDTAVGASASKGKRTDGKWVFPGDGE
jgi:hypothetical protein